MARGNAKWALTLLAAAMVLAAVPTARAGAVFEIREAPPKSAAELQFQFTDLVQVKDVGSIARSGLEGAGAAFKTSAVPLAIFTLNKCTAVAPHVHPNGAETLFVLEGKIRVTQFTGERDTPSVLTYELSAGEAGYIQQGTIHTVENICSGTAKFLQIFDHPQAGAVFAAPGLLALPRNVVNSAFSEDVLPGKVAAKGPLIRVRDCAF